MILFGLLRYVPINEYLHVIIVYIFKLYIVCTYITYIIICNERIEEMPMTR